MVADELKDEDTSPDPNRDEEDDDEPSKPDDVEDDGPRREPNLLLDPMCANKSEELDESVGAAGIAPSPTPPALPEMPCLARKRSNKLMLAGGGCFTAAPASEAALDAPGGLADALLEDPPSSTEPLSFTIGVPASLRAFFIGPPAGVFRIVRVARCDFAT